MKLDSDKAIKDGVEQAMRECELTIGMTLKEAVEKQIPKKPIKIDETYNPERQEWDCDYECPSCGNPYADDSYCSCCGQALDWSDSE